MNLQTILRMSRHSYDLLPASMESAKANVMVLSFGLQESRFTARYQIVSGGGKGPARSFYQFEKGSERTRAGVTGVYMHAASREHLRKVCEFLAIPFTTQAIWEAMEYNDVLAFAVARLMIYTDPRPLPEIGNAQAAWDYYIRVWNPGKPHRDTWDALYTKAVQAVKDFA